MNRPSWKPTADQELLLHAALDPIPDALAAWRMWSARALPPETLDTDSFKLLPLVCTTLADHLGDNPMLPLLREITAAQSAKTLTALGRAARAIALLNTEGIETVLLKGAALLAMKVASLKARPMTDADILIAPDDRARALKVLLAAGWVSKHPIPVTRYPLIHSLDLSFHADGSGLDLHWYALWDNRQPGADRAFVEGSVPVSLFQTPTRRLNDTDLLLHLLAHGGHLSRIPSRRWVADVVILLRSGATIDRQRFIDEAAARGLSLQTTAMLTYLVDEFNVPLPDEFIDDLRRVRPSLGERIEYWARERQTQPWAGGLFHLNTYWRLTRRAHRRLSLTHYLRMWWGVPESSSLAGEALHRLKHKRTDAVE